MSSRLPSEEAPSGSSRGQKAAQSESVSRRETLLREARRLLAARAYDEVIRKLEVHQPAEWSAVDEIGARLIRLIGQARMGQNDFSDARDAFEHLRSLQQEKPLLSKRDFVATLTDLGTCYRELGLNELAEQCQREAHRWLQSEE